MSGLRIVPVDPADDALLRGWHAAYAEADAAGRGPQAAFWQLEEVRAELATEQASRWALAWAGLDGDRVVTTGRARGSEVDNLELMEAYVHTVPDARGRGHGSAMLAHLEAVARERGRTLLATETSWPHDDHPEGEGVVGVDWLRRRGFTLGLVDVHRELALPVDAALLDELAADAAAHHEGYELRSFVGPVPDDILQGWADLVSTIITEAPLGDLEREQQSADPAVVRDNEALVAAQGRTKLNTVALDPAGDVVAYTDLCLTAHEPDRAYQWGTLVRRDARGHRLGLAVKVANLRLLQREAPQVRRLTTYNAEVNEHMIAVNRRLGFREVERLGELEKRLA
ncbi:GNAT family N-acetyltransferase [Nocardioides sp. SYSU D00038]|uniref:GNAT family N-acetyltransferase n=1 Tax=Nocardioides sp. SYSU D00038 TaxID=2812554 RepID=UPI0019673040|nr:GNAT family N-acetyltransferase [Nocardioides sp. SYSU D00038]